MQIIFDDIGKKRNGMLFWPNVTDIRNFYEFFPYFRIRTLLNYHSVNNIYEFVKEKRKIMGRIFETFLFENVNSLLKQTY